MEVSEDDPDVAYVKLPGYPANRVPRTPRSVRLHDCIGKYQGPDLRFDFDDAGVLVGIEILA